MEALHDKLTAELELVHKDSERARNVLINMITQVNVKLALKKGETRPIDDIWHAEAPDDVLRNVNKLQRFVENEVWLQFSYHFDKIQTQETKQRQTHGYPSNRKVSHMALRLMELEGRQRAELEATKRQNMMINPQQPNLSI